MDLHQNFAEVFVHMFVCRACDIWPEKWLFGLHYGSSSCFVMLSLCWCTFAIYLLFKVATVDVARAAMLILSQLYCHLRTLSFLSFMLVLAVFIYNS